MHHLAPPALASLDQLLRVEPRVVALPDGRRLAFDQRGDPAGRPRLWWHGSPSCRLEAVMFHEQCRARGVRLIVPDRPGLGRSDPRPGLSVAEVARSLGPLLDALELDQVEVWGGSGGGPYALASAAVLPDRVSRVVALASGGVDSEDPGASSLFDRLWALLAARAPWAMATALSLVRAGRHLPPRAVTWAARLAFFSVEAAPFRGLPFARLFQALAGEAMRAGVAGAVEDFARSGKPWGFSVGEVRRPVLLVQGRRDGFVPVSQSRSFAARLPEARLVVRPDQGHFGTIFDWDFVEAALGSPAGAASGPP
jgi:pimeloyl-ACP methyl ester carboxylesterase